MPHPETALYSRLPPCRRKRGRSETMRLEAGHETLHHKQQRVRRDMQIKIDKTVQQDPGYGDDCSGADTPGQMVTFFPEAPARFAVKQPQNANPQSPPAIPVSANASM